MFSKLNPISSPFCYQIQRDLSSESAHLLFAHDLGTNEQVVIKFLQPYKDLRYHLETLKERQQCQSIALARNRRFNPGKDIYIGLGLDGKSDEERKMLCFSEVKENLSTLRKSHLRNDAEYALIMKQLAEKRRLDVLLHAERFLEEKHLISSLSASIVHMHTYLSPAVSPDEQWGSTKNLYEKLEHNIDLFADIEKKDKYKQYKKYYSLKKDIIHIFQQKRYQQCFEQRKQQRLIKRCHGDLKTSNIWIEPFSQYWERNLRLHVLILDAIDFNPLYSNIDILSDFAMLVVDMLPRVQSSAVIDHLVNDYLEQTGQMNRVSQMILSYYLLEKAFVRAAISIAHDTQPDSSRPGIGLCFLQMAYDLKEQLKDTSQYRFTLPSLDSRCMPQ